MTSGDRETPIPELQYEPPPSVRPVTVEHDAGVTRVLLGMTGIYAPIPNFSSGSEVDLVLIPLWLLVKMAALAVALIRRRPNPPRAVFEIDGDEARILFRDPSTGALTRFEFPRDAMFEARVNRFEKGFWLSVPGQIKSTFLLDVPRRSLAAFEAEIQAVRSTPAPAATPM